MKRLNKYKFKRDGIISWDTTAMHNDRSSYETMISDSIKETVDLTIENDDDDDENLDMDGVAQFDWDELQRNEDEESKNILDAYERDFEMFKQAYQRIADDYYEEQRNI